MWKFEIVHGLLYWAPRYIPNKVFWNHLKTSWYEKISNDQPFLFCDTQVMRGRSLNHLETIYYTKEYSKIFHFLLCSSVSLLYTRLKHNNKNEKFPTNQPFLYSDTQLMRGDPKYSIFVVVRLSISV